MADDLVPCRRCRLDKILRGARLTAILHDRYSLLLQIGATSGPCRVEPAVLASMNRDRDDWFTMLHAAKLGGLLQTRAQAFA